MNTKYSHWIRRRVDSKVCSNGDMSFADVLFLRRLVQNRSTAHLNCSAKDKSDEQAIRKPRGLFHPRGYCHSWLTCTGSIDSSLCNHDRLTTLRVRVKRMFLLHLDLSLSNIKQRIVRLLGAESEWLVEFEDRVTNLIRRVVCRCPIISNHCANGQTS